MNIVEVGKANLFISQSSPLLLFTQLEDLCLLLMCKVATVKVILEETCLERWIHLLPEHVLHLHVFQPRMTEYV
jgi:hypothetical protein